MRSNRSFLLACSTSLLLACGGSAGGGASLEIRGSPTAPVVPAVVGVGPWTGAGSPTSLGQVFYRAWVSENEDCSSPVLLEDHGDAGKAIDFYDEPVVFEASPAEGTYPCLIVEASDTMTFRPDAVAEAAHGSTVCTAGAEYEFDTFKVGDPDRMTLGGPAQVGAGTVETPVAQRTYAYFSTDPEAVAAHDHQKLQLASPLIVPGQSTLYADFSGQVSHSDTGECWLEPGVVGFY